MRWLAAVILFTVAAPSADIRYFRYQRPLTNIPAQPQQACLVVDPSLFAHAASGLADVRLYRDRIEAPYLIQKSGPAIQSVVQNIAALNLGVRSRRIVFDSAMPEGAYSDLQLNISAHDFIATVDVAGSQQQGGPATKVGTYTIFDLSRQRLGRSTVLHLPTSDFRYLHFSVSGPLHPEDVGGISLGQVSTAKPAYVTVAESHESTRKDRSTLIEFTVPANVPVDRVVFSAPEQPANFSRDVTINVEEVSTRPRDEAALPLPTYTSRGNLLRVHTTQADHKIDLESMDVTTGRAVFGGPSRWVITIDNGDDAPLVPSMVRLEMFERDICFQSAPGEYALYYGDTALSAPRYDLAQFTVIHPQDAARVSAGAEQPNPQLQSRPDDRPFSERHPALLWIALAVVIALLGLIALRTARSQTPPSSEG
ncbi:MAG: DUF3999 family protein [Acidobacteria bacterium]|nr:DUF3999 family protein [Acidobacteriota bacterium]